MTFTPRVSLVLALLVSSLGCAASVADDDAETAADREAAVRLRPRGTANARLLVRPPALAAGTSTGSLSMSVGGTTIPLGVTTELTAGAAELRLIRTGLNDALEMRRPVDLRAGVLTEVTLAGYVLRGVPTPPAADRLLGIDLRASGMPSVIQEGPVNTSPGGSIGPSSSYASQTHLRFEGQRFLNWGLYDGLPIGLRAGEVTEVDVRDLSTRAATRIVFPAAELPDCTTSFVLESEEQPGNRRVSAEMVRTPGARILVAHAPWNLTKNIQYRVRSWASNAAFALPFRVPTVAGRVDEVRLGRLDVDDVEIPKDDTFEYRRGRYTVYPTGVGVARTAIASCATNTGIDLPPGNYEVVVEYDQLSGAKAQIVERVEVTPD